MSCNFGPLTAISIGVGAPKLMTFEGRNIDILVGLTAIPVGWIVESPGGRREARSCTCRVATLRREKLAAAKGDLRAALER